MNKVAKFEKVSREQFIMDMSQKFPIEVSELDKLYDEIQLPKRGTAESAGYDFRMPVTVSLKAGEVITVPTGIRCKIESGNVLLIVPRSSMGFKYGLRLLNTVGVIDADYYEATNEGHIMAKIKVDKDVTLSKSDRFIQGILVPFGITEDDEADAKRVGGIGSTGK